MGGTTGAYVAAWVGVGPGVHAAVSCQLNVERDWDRRGRARVEACTGIHEREPLSPNKPEVKRAASTVGGRR